MQAFIYHLTMMRSKRYIQETYGKSFWKQFQALSDPVFHQVSKELPDIGDSIFSFNYMPMHRLMWHGIGQCSN